MVPRMWVTYAWGIFVLEAHGLVQNVVLSKIRLVWLRLVVVTKIVLMCGEDKIDIMLIVV